MKAGLDVSISSKEAFRDELATLAVHNSKVVDVEYERMNSIEYISAIV